GGAERACLQQVAGGGVGRRGGRGRRCRRGGAGVRGGCRQGGVVRARKLRRVLFALPGLAPLALLFGLRAGLQLGVGHRHFLAGQQGVEVVVRVAAGGRRNRRRQRRVLVRGTGGRRRGGVGVGARAVEAVFAVGPEQPGRRQHHHQGDHDA